MGMAGMAEIIGLAVLGAALVDAVVSDLRCRRIPDRDPLLAAAAFAGLAALGALPLTHLAAAAVVLAGGFVLFAKGLWGGGDAKLAAALGLFVGFAGMPRFLVVMALAGGILAVVVLVLRRLPGGAARSAELPYGVAIAAAGADWIARAGMSGLAG
ncbi:prepilin peptidase [Magnetospirillum sp. UT-4]|uniref:A24 family peptidase n=1 Tax=Magnetospirillum sp. UT-4 TaxID=2681467 RepID=UPI0020C58461|nr:prepilin peptidase [Magnetospirillum sp. UT-4]